MAEKTDRKNNVTRKASKGFQIIEFRNAAQQIAWSVIEQHDVVFIVGPAGTAKSHLAVAYAVTEVLAKRKKKIILTRPIVEAGEKLGFLPGTFEEKINPYLMPIYDCMDRILNQEMREKINNSIEIEPLAYLRGRAEPLSNLLPTPTGLIRMGDIRVGDYVFGADGSPTLVKGVYPQGLKNICKVYFSDGSFVLCSEDHLWVTRTLSEKRHNKGFSVKSTKCISEHIKTKWGQKNHEIPMLLKSVEFKNDVENYLNPYLMGVLLGDGCFSQATASVTLTNIDDSLISHVKKCLPKDIELVPFDISFRLSCGNKRANPIKSELKKLGLFGLKSYEKFVPDVYKFNSSEVRLEVLRGLMDTDGWISNSLNKCRIQHYTTSKKLSEDLKFLVESLGGICHVRKRKFLASDQHFYKGKLIKHVKSLYVSDIVMPVGLNPFKCARKVELYKNQARVKRMVSKVEYVGQMECQCISVDAVDNLYLTENFIVTHNTFYDSVCILDEAQNCKEEQVKMFLTRLGDGSKMIITGDPTQTDLQHERPLNMIVDSMKAVHGIGIVEFNEDNIVRHPLVSSILKAWPK